MFITAVCVLFFYVLLMHCLLYEKENSRILAHVPRLSLNKLVPTVFKLHYHCQTSIYGHHTNRAKCLHNKGIPIIEVTIVLVQGQI